MTEAEVREAEEAGMRLPAVRKAVRELRRLRFERVVTERVVWGAAVHTAADSARLRRYSQMVRPLRDVLGGESCGDEADLLPPPPNPLGGAATLRGDEPAREMDYLDLGDREVDCLEAITRARWATFDSGAQIKATRPKPEGE